jgi:hypothetical protein
MSLLSHAYAVIESENTLVEEASKVSSIVGNPGNAYFVFDFVARFAMKRKANQCFANR